MSDSNTLILADVTEDVRVDIRRFTGYPAYGFGTIGFVQFALFLPAYQVLETRLNNLTTFEYARITDYFLPKLNQLEEDIYNVRDIALVDTAAVFKRNANEIGDRERLFRRFRNELCNFLGIQGGPMLRNSSGRNVDIIPY